jgi:aldehyde:ferredoxin oxidoreductase
MGIVIKGKARKPVYLRLYNGEAEICDASSLWGMDTYEVEELLRRETDGKVSVAAIGRAGEKLVRFAAIMNDGKKGRAAARCGLGALMGSKKLKAIVVGGNQEIPVFDRARLKECTKKIYHSCPRKKLTDVIEDYVEEIKLAFRTGGVPVKNWRGGAHSILLKSSAIVCGGPGWVSAAAVPTRILNQCTTPMAKGTLFGSTGALWARTA